MDYFQIFGFNPYIWIITQCKSVMQTLNYTIVSEEMVWLWYYDQLQGKHFKELLDREARTFIAEIGVRQQHVQMQELVAEKRDGSEG